MADAIKQESVTLTLSIEEAETLLAVGAKVGGDKHNSPRGHYDSVVQALISVGVRDFTAYGPHPYKHLNRQAPGLMFSSTPQKDTSPHYYSGLDPFRLSF